MFPTSFPHLRALQLCVLSLVLSLPAQAQSAPSPRFEGSGALTQTPPRSADGRFALQARLSPAADAAEGGRFSLSAALRPDVSAGAACAPPDGDLFSNGFE
jgi:hypothetical protein